MKTLKAAKEVVGVKEAGNGLILYEITVADRTPRNHAETRVAEFMRGPACCGTERISGGKNSIPCCVRNQNKPMFD